MKHSLFERFDAHKSSQISSRGNENSIQKANSASILFTSDFSSCYWAPNMPHDHQNNEQHLCSHICTFSLVSLPAEPAFWRKFIDQLQLQIFFQMVSPSSPGFSFQGTKLGSSVHEHRFSVVAQSTFELYVQAHTTISSSCMDKEQNFFNVLLHNAVTVLHQTDF